MPGILCEHCTAVCCRYIALPIDKPMTTKDFDDVRWYLLHEGVMVFVEDGDWYISVATSCRHLRADHMCGIYETRPRICRDYTTENCDYHSGDYNWQFHFSCPEHLDEYLRMHPPLSARKGAKTKRGRTGLRIKLPNRRKRAAKATDYVAATSDIRGVPLPVLRLPFSQ
ncbi:MAG: YkgJ family cysteine cluster protein [Phycisphaerales bacterium]|nr:YkgJ family cysteine cluster protein [Phycisphaerales bacterium]